MIKIAHLVKNSLQTQKTIVSLQRFRNKAYDCLMV